MDRGEKTIGDGGGGGRERAIRSYQEGGGKGLYEEKRKEVKNILYKRPSGDPEGRKCFPKRGKYAPPSLTLSKGLLGRGLSTLILLSDEGMKEDRVWGRKAVFIQEGEERTSSISQGYMEGGKKCATPNNEKTRVAD